LFEYCLSKILKLQGEGAIRRFSRMIVQSCKTSAHGMPM
jgi:hypothetical protein